MIHRRPQLGNVKERKVDRYDGQSIYIDGQARPSFELGNYLGGGAAGVVYEAVCTSTRQHYAIKILNPVGFKLLPSGPLQRYIVAVKGMPLTPEQEGVMTCENVWWLVHPNSRQVVAAYEDSRYGGLRELPLPKCVEIWGWDPPEASDTESGQDHEADPHRAAAGSELNEVQIRGVSVTIPRVPRKYVKFLRARRSIYREISNMAQLSVSGHPNVLVLEEVLEHIQDSKTTIFLVLELASGGELFDRIKVDEGTEEETARMFLRQLLSGIAYCHKQGVCHRDLKPENLLLSDDEVTGIAVLKIADFGLSALFCAHDAGSSGGCGPGSGWNADGQGAAVGGGASELSPVAPELRRLTSVVGSPHYVAPEVLQDSGVGYDGAQADVWSAGVILYAMLAGNLPFGKDLLNCPRFHKFSHWLRKSHPRSERTPRVRALQRVGRWANSEVAAVGTSRSKADVDVAALTLANKHRARHSVSSDNGHDVVAQQQLQAQLQQHQIPTAHQTQPTHDASLAVNYPLWFFPAHFTVAAKSLLTAMLDPDPMGRLTVTEAQLHEWIRGGDLVNNNSTNNSNNSSILISSQVGSINGVGANGAAYGCEAGTVLAADTPGNAAPEADVRAATLPGGLPSLDGGVGLGSTADDQNSAPGPSEPAADVGSVLAAAAASSTTSVREPGQAESESAVSAMTDRLGQSTLGSLSMGGCAVTSPGSGRSMSHGGPSVDTDSPDVSPVLESLQQSRRRRVANNDSTGESSRECDASLGRASADPSRLVVDDAVEQRSERLTCVRRRRGDDGTEMTSAERPGSRPKSSRPNSRSSRPVFHSPPLAPSPVAGPMSRNVDDGFSLEASPQADDPPDLCKSPTGHRSTSWGSRRRLDDLTRSGTRRAMSRNLSATLGTGNQGGEERDGCGDGSSGEVPVFQDLVKRSTRFSTSVPAAEVLRHIAEIIAANPHPMRPPFRNIRQQVRVQWNTYKLEVRRGAVMVCTVQIFLMRPSMYMVEFLRGQLDIFQFKRFYEDIRVKLSAVVKNDYSLQLLSDGGAPHAPLRSAGDTPAATKLKRALSY